MSRSRQGAKNLPPQRQGYVPGSQRGILKGLDADIPVKKRIATENKISRRVDDLVDREVDAAGTPKPYPKSVVNKAEYSELAIKKKRIVVSDEESDDDAPLVHSHALYIEY